MLLQQCSCDLCPGRGGVGLRIETTFPAVFWGVEKTGGVTAGAEVDMDGELASCSFYTACHIVSNPLACHTLQMVSEGLKCVLLTPVICSRNIHLFFVPEELVEERNIIPLLLWSKTSTT